MIDKDGIPGRLRPFDESGVQRRADSVLHYEGLAPSLLEMLRRTVEAVPAQEAVVEVGGPRLSYRELWDRSARVAGGLVAAGVGRGDRVAVRLGNGVDWCLAFFGTLLAGGVVVPVNTRLSASEVDYVVTDSGASYVVAPGGALPDGEPVVVDDLRPSDLAAIFYTSGTTGFPKGAMTTHENFLSNVETCRRIMDLPTGSIRNLVSVPLFHVTGCNSQLLPTCRLAGTTVIMPAFDVRAFLRVIVEERIDLLTSVPAIFWLAMTQPDFAEFDMSGVRWVTYGGAPTPPEQVARMMEAFPNARLGNGFGLTETASVATFLPHEWADRRAETVGFAVPPVEVDLFEPDPETGAGELLIRGPNVVAGYWQKPDATAAAFVDGWLHTGDVAKVDGDGFVQIVDRKKDMINRGGENVYCVEVENALAGHPAVFEVAVLGVPDTMMGEKVGAVIVARPGAELDPREVTSWAREVLADFKIPQYVVVRSDPLPRNPGGKVLKPVLRKETSWGAPLR
ncbi:MAG TPA: AMP-binding protein [Acidimicrobiales bacterium]|nr:AMP-binding protein [Acidimicrobiales bacterium]